MFSDFLSRRIVFLFLTVALSGFAAMRPAEAIDCGKAKSRIEQALCSKAKLARLDADFAKVFFALLKSISQESTLAERETLLAEQRAWLMSREASCGGLESGSLYECLESGLHRRRAQLESEWGLRAADRDLTKVKQFSVGTERIDVNPSCGKDGTNCCISHKGKEIGCGWEGLYGEPPFSVLRRLKNGEDEAVLLGVRGGGQMNCVEYSILSVAAHRELQIQKFGEVCMVPSKYGHAFRTGQGFAFFREAAAAYPGEHLQWRFESGFSRTAVPFTPSGGKTIEELVDADPKNFVAPLHNETFYRAVAALPEPERARFLVSLSGLGGGCDCAGPADNSLYGLRNTPDVYAMSGCGLYLEGHFLHCSGADALAVWDKRSRKFHFAIAPDDERENRQPSAALHAFPPLENWTAPARSQLLDWRNKPKWEKGE